MKQQSFFEKYANEYDWLTNAQGRAVNHEKEVKGLIDRFHPGSVLDAGCATGLTTSLFALNGIPSVGLDCSRAMLAIANDKFRSSELPISFQYGKFENLPKTLANSFEMVVCLANSIVGVESVTGLKKSMNSFFKVLKTEGILVLQLLNHESLKVGDIQTIKMTKHENLYYLRYLERTQKKMVLSIIRADIGSVPPSFEIFKNEHNLFSKRILSQSLQQAGFREIKIYSDLLLTQKFSNKAKDIVIIAKKSKTKYS